jgi:hypothetical protein
MYASLCICAFIYVYMGVQKGKENTMEITGDGTCIELFSFCMGNLEEKRTFGRTMCR